MWSSTLANDPWILLPYLHGCFHLKYTHRYSKNMSTQDSQRIAHIKMDAVSLTWFHGSKLVDGPFFQLKHSIFTDPDTFSNTRLISQGEARRPSRLLAEYAQIPNVDRSVWVYGQAPASDRSQESVMIPKRSDHLSSLWLITRSFKICFFFLYCTSSLVLCKAQTTLYLLTPWTSHSAKFIVGKVECPKKVFFFCTPFL